MGEPRKRLGATLERVAFKTSRLAEFSGRRELVTQTGHTIEAVCKPDERGTGQCPEDLGGDAVCAGRQDRHDDDRDVGLSDHPVISFPMSSIHFEGFTSRRDALEHCGSAGAGTRPK